MTKDVIVSISGMQFDTQGDTPLEVITVGNYYYKNGKHYILYDEMLDDSGVETKNTIKISGDRVDVIKKGQNNVHMVFEPYHKNMACYQTPYGSMMIGINTLGITKEEDELNIRTKLTMRWRSIMRICLTAPLRLILNPKTIRTLVLECDFSDETMFMVSDTGFLK